MGDEQLDLFGGLATSPWQEENSAVGGGGAVDSGQLTVDSEDALRAGKGELATEGTGSTEGYIGVAPWSPDFTRSSPPRLGAAGDFSEVGYDTLRPTNEELMGSLVGPRWPGGPDGRSLDEGVASVALEQDLVKLRGISAYSYDLEDPGFQDYAVKRGVLYVAGRPGSRMWDYFRDPSLGLDDWLADERVRFAQAVEGKRHRYTDEALRSQWVAVEIGRGKLEDCWGIWKRVDSGQLTVDS
jgi:hypothetical protein